MMKTGLGLTPDQMHEVLAEWNKGELDSYLIEISRDILAFKDTDGPPLVDKILDTAGQKGTGKWTVVIVPRPGHSDHADCRGGLFALRFGHEGRAREGGEEIERAQARPSRATDKKGSSQTSATRFTPRKLSATRRATCSCARRRRNTNGT